MLGIVSYASISEQRLQMTINSYKLLICEDNKMENMKRSLELTNGFVMVSTKTVSRLTQKGEICAVFPCHNTLETLQALVKFT